MKTDSVLHLICLGEIIRSKQFPKSANSLKISFQHLNFHMTKHANIVQDARISYVNSFRLKYRIQRSSLRQDI